MFLALLLPKAMAPHSSTLAWKIPWMEEPGRLQSMGSLGVWHDWATSLSLFTFHFHALQKEMATHSSVLAWRIPGMGEPGGLPSLGSHRVGHDWSDLAAAAKHPHFFHTFCPGGSHFFSSSINFTSLVFLLSLLSSVLFTLLVHTHHHPTLNVTGNTPAKCLPEAFLYSA